MEACNYQPTSTVDDGSCNYPAEGYDCNGGCLLDSDGDGVCDPFEVEGCTLDLASNFDPLATDDDGSCVVTGCTEPTAENFDPIANEDDGSCVVLGCTDPFALNPNAIATEDDGSCEYPEPSFQGLTWEEVGQEAGGIPVYRVYANFTNPLDQVIAVFGDDDEPMTVSSTNGFAQASGSSAFAFDVLEPTTAQEDSWFTLGAEPGTTVAVTTIGTEGAASTFEGGGFYFGRSLWWGVVCVPRCRARGFSRCVRQGIVGAIGDGWTSDVCGQSSTQGPGWSIQFRRGSFPSLP